MTRITNPMLAGLVAAGLFAALPVAAVAQDVDSALLQQGQQIYESNCAACHQPDGSGFPPDFPTLAGNPHLEDLQLIVGNVHHGKGAMPAFPNLTADEIAAVATYVRNTWGNAFGAVSAEEVTTVIASLDSTDTGEAVSIWSGVFTTEQADRGATYYSGVCAKCHGLRLNGAGEPDQPPSPAVARAGFLTKWDGSTLQTLFAYIEARMPLDNPGQLTDEQTTDVIAHMLAVSGAEPGASELPADPAALAAYVIGPKPN